jgi:hypothetical protein
MAWGRDLAADRCLFRSPQHLVLSSNSIAAVCAVKVTVSGVRSIRHFHTIVA